MQTLESDYFLGFFVYYHFFPEKAKSENKHREQNDILLIM